MAKGRRLALANQAMLVWADKLDVGYYLETGKVGQISKHLPANPLADKIAQDIERNGGHLIVDPVRFAQLQKELDDGRPQ